MYRIGNAPPVDFGKPHRGRKRNSLLKKPVGNRAGSLRGAAVSGAAMHGLPQWPAGYAVPAKKSDQLPGRTPEAHGVHKYGEKPPGGSCPGRLALAPDPGHCRKSGGIGKRNRALFLQKLIELLKLGASERRLNIRKAVVESDFFVKIFVSGFFGLGRKVSHQSAGFLIL